MGRAGLSALGELVRRHDPDRYFCTLFAPAEKREVLFTLYAFNHELARCREVVREPFAALIRLQWWREVVEGARRRHEVAGPLGAALDAGLLDAGVLLGMIEGREMEAEPIETMAAFEAYVLATAGGVMVAAAGALGMEGAEAVRGWGAAYGVAGGIKERARFGAAGAYCSTERSARSPRAERGSYLGKSSACHFGPPGVDGARAAVDG